MGKREGLPENYEPPDTPAEKRFWGGCLLVLLALLGLLIWAILRSEGIV